MANTLNRYVSTEVGLVASTIYTVAASTKATMMGCHVCNRTSSAITIVLKAAGAFVAKDVSIPANTSLDVLSGSRINLNAADTVTISCNTPVGADAILSVLENT